MNFDLNFSKEATEVLHYLINELYKFSVLSKKKMACVLAKQNELHADFNIAFCEFVQQSYNSTIISTLQQHGLNAPRYLTRTQMGFYNFVHMHFSRLSQKNTRFQILHAIHLRMCGTSNSGIDFLHSTDIW